MQTNRRHFLRTSASASALFATGLAGWSSTRNPHPSQNDDHAPDEERAPMRILILGGTGFLGPALIDAVLARGHSLSLFNSGRTEGQRESAGRPSVVPEGVEELVGNRDPLLTADDRRLADDPDIEAKRDPASPKGLTQLEGREWDAVIDTSGYFPRLVRASAELLAPHVGQYVFISTISVYARNDVPDQDESAPLAELSDPAVEEFGADFANYGGAKALCEAAAEAAMPGRTTNIRPGFIVGRRDTSRRWTYWPVRTALGGEMLVPGTPEDPVQIIDVRDLAEWIVHCIEERVVGVFNATGPAQKLSMQAMLAGCAEAAGTQPEFVWADPEFLAEQEVNFPIWVPPTGETAGFHRVDVSKASEHGLTFRTVRDTAADTLAWVRSLSEDLQARMVPPSPTPEQEAAILELWRARAPK